MSAGPLLEGRIKQIFTASLSPLVRLLAGAGLNPNTISFAGLLLSAVAGLAYSLGLFLSAAFLVTASGICDSLDGLVARRAGKASGFGAFLDSTLDRLGEVFVFLGLAWFFSSRSAYLNQSPIIVIFIILAIEGSFMVSYTRARAEALGISCTNGLMQRPERMVLLIVGSLLGSVPAIGLVSVKITIYLLAVLTNLTVIERIRHTRKEMTMRNGPFPSDKMRDYRK
ncbi:MAG: CDP-alcohol phosphatidyltransferase family protein [Deltaproteobacteria bacterium CG_4_8_14_3_um_filter_51_11]|nr:CDP-alcohol phosphatidyltransferase family protein [bacterium]OIP40419.1 MAG: hypothetical protein AUK25_07755 [Desulfobacteraceae bacterium CG2_30_51_40]PIP45796.1 MAG: CDP-alcohol phosphatidyltransferase [Deltaproteobacteria bacterium CG23_combo_of_CG06-09_8_20_14_all_51_20]PIX19910.1 MAG: CDP-alcohol phosphatidyltransferase family protein [Deltaproteobacteria bacterium CG_4_8_14_3_um_filter_51_11]PJB36358.1 MAG: CDP-alcohol phosphatidyltransferase family protein [Deltaproteobacteria bacte